MSALCLSGGRNSSQSAVSTVRQYDGFTQDYTFPYWQAADIVVSVVLVASFDCTVMYGRAANVVGLL